MLVIKRLFSVLLVLVIAISWSEYRRYKAAHPKVDDTDSTASQSVSSAHLGNEWPLRVTSGKVSCELGARYVFEDPNGQRWAINGAATGPYPAILPLQLDNPNPALACRPDEPNCVTPKMSLSPLFDIAERLCKK